jgi:DNA adenine methylase
VDGLPEIVQRLQRVQIENAPALEVIDRYDTVDTLFYLDPPYVHESRGDSKAYAIEMTDDDHVEMADKLSRIKGRAVVSGYRTKLYDEIFWGWDRVDADEKTCNSSKHYLLIPLIKFFRV